MGTDPPGPELAERLAALGPLADRLRRSLYLYVAAQPHEVGRDEAAAAAGVARSTAAFHLDKLADAGLLETSYRRLSGRTGPGAGRPDKLYRRSAGEYELSLPPRSYHLVAEVLAEAVEGAEPGPVLSSVSVVARRRGHTMGREIGAGLGSRAGRERKLAALEAALDRLGYQPYREAREVRLRNCPFDRLAEGHRELVCGMNLSLVAGVLAGMEAGELEARPEATPGQCCVRVAAAPGATSTRPSRPGPRQGEPTSANRQQEVQR